MHARLLDVGGKTPEANTVMASKPKVKPTGGRGRPVVRSGTAEGVPPDRPRVGRTQIAGVQRFAKYRKATLAAKLIGEVQQGGSDVNTLCNKYGLKREELGRMTGFSLRALAEWSGGKLPSQPAKRRLHEIRRLLDALDEIVNTEGISPWLHEPNRAFDGLRPLQVIELGEIDRLWGMIYEMKAGSVS